MVVPMKVKVDEQTCIRCGTCAVVCGKVFEIGPDGKANITEKYRGEKYMKEQYQKL